MLPSERRLRRSTEIAAVVRGSRCGTPRMVVHSGPAGVPGRSRFGLAVSTAVGGSVVRHQVARRLRHVLAAQAAEWDVLDVDVVVRALPPAASAESDQLASDLRKCLRKWSSDGLRDG